jgi:dual specificity protein kinase YAK1
MSNPPDSPPPAEELRDDPSGHLILTPGDLIQSPTGQSYRVVSLLHRSPSSQIVHVFEVPDPNLTFALKISNSQDADRRRADREVTCHAHLSANALDTEKPFFCQLHSTFLLSGHRISVLELLSKDLFKVIADHNHRGFRLPLIQAAGPSLFESLVFLQRCQFIHSDLRPENLLVSNTSQILKLTDFRMARHITERPFSPVQSLYYRAPEVILRNPHGYPIDVWSMGAILAEMFLGLPIFAGQSEIQVLEKMVALLGPVPLAVSQGSPRFAEFFHDDGRLKTEAQYCADLGIPAEERHDFIVADSLRALVTHFSMPRMAAGPRRTLAAGRELFLDLLQRMFAYDPAERIGPQDVLAHRFWSFQLAP